LVGSWLEAARIVAAVQVCSDGKADLSFCGSGIVEDLLVGVEWFTSPVSRHLRKKTMLDRVPFGSSGWIVGHGDRQCKRVGQLRLELGLPGIAAIAVAAAGISQNENLARAGVALGTKTSASSWA
jgi:hypothetical protein